MPFRKLIVLATPENPHAKKAWKLHGTTMTKSHPSKVVSGVEERERALPK